MKIIHKMPESVAPLQVIQVIGLRGCGEKDDPVRHVLQYYSMDGRLLAENDTFRTPWIDANDLPEPQFE